MAEAEIARHVEEAQQRWALLGVTVIHRYGRITPGENIVLVVTASSHRADAFAAAEFLMDYLKTRAPFWKQVEGARAAKPGWRRKRPTMRLPNAGTAKRAGVATRPNKGGLTCPVFDRGSNGVPDRASERTHRCCYCWRARRCLAAGVRSDAREAVIPRLIDARRTRIARCSDCTGRYPLQESAAEGTDRLRDDAFDCVTYCEAVLAGATQRLSAIPGSCCGASAMRR